MKELHKETKYEHEGILIVHREGDIATKPISLFSKRSNQETAGWHSDVEGTRKLEEALGLFHRKIGAVKPTLNAADQIREATGSRPRKDIQGPSSADGAVVIQMADEDHYHLIELANQVIDEVNQIKGEWVKNGVAGIPLPMNRALLKALALAEVVNRAVVQSLTSEDFQERDEPFDFR
jgi:hypothetical protein